MSGDAKEDPRTMGKGKGKGRLLLSPLTYLQAQLNTTAKTRSPHSHLKVKANTPKALLHFN